MMTRKEIVTELAERAEVSRRAAETFLDTLAELVYREAADGFTLPGLCRFKVAQRKAAKRYNVVTGTHFTVAAHQVLKIVPLKVARNAIAPVPDNLLTTDVPDDEEAALVDDTVDGRPVLDPDLELPPTYLPHIAAVSADTAPTVEDTNQSPMPEAAQNATPQSAQKSEEADHPVTESPPPSAEQPTKESQSADRPATDEQPTLTPAVASPSAAAKEIEPVSPTMPSVADEEQEEDLPPLQVETKRTPQPDAGDEATFDFPCPHCGETIAALPADAGAEGICPECRGEFRIPDILNITEEIKMTQETERAEEERAVQGVSDFVTFFCNECGQEIEAPLEMVGLKADCPACGSRLQVPQKGSTFEEEGAEEVDADQKKPDDPSMTVRMDLSDFLS